MPRDTPGQKRLDQFGFRRRIELNIQISADSWKHLHSQLRDIEFTLHDEREGYISILSGGGYILEGDVDPEWTEERYFEALTEWREGRLAAKPKEEADA